MSQPLHHLYLTGYRGSGKTSVGKLLGMKLNRPVIDLDDRIEWSAKISIREIFEREGESGFRDRESSELLQISKESPSVVSLGGGAVLREQNQQVLEATGFCVWLKVDADTVLERLTQDSNTATRRPSLTHLPAREEVLTLLMARAPIYASVSNAQIDVMRKSIKAIAEEIISLLPEPPPSH